jgi:hypothetical protein
MKRNRFSSNCCRKARASFFRRRSKTPSPRIGTVAGWFLRAFLRLPRRCQGQPEQVEVPRPLRDRACPLDSLYFLLMDSCHSLAFANTVGRHDRSTMMLRHRQVQRVRASNDFSDGRRPDPDRQEFSEQRKEIPEQRATPP